ncbi:MAG: adenylate/guanylate cyclase domain-containing protein, partial [Candidatus Eremiobacterota bacterium]
KIPVTGREVVARAVREIQMEDNNLDHIVHRLQAEPELSPWLERIVVQGEKIRFNRMTNPRLARLELIGLIKADKDGNCRIRNPLYREIAEAHLGAEGRPGPAAQPTQAVVTSVGGQGHECTAVSVDVVDSTRLKQNQDKVDVTYTFQQYHQYVGNLVRRHSGHIKDAAGDGLMAVFESAESALECCREIQVHLPAFNRRHNRLESTLEVRIGVNTGSVLTHDLGDQQMTRNLYDYTLDLAGKVQKGAGAREIAITHHTMAKLNGPIPVAREEYWPEYDIRVYVLDPFQQEESLSGR